MRTDVFAFAPVVRGQNRLEVKASGEEQEIILIGTIGKSWWDDSGITEQEVRDAIKSIPKGQKINLKVNSEGGSVKEGLGIYNAIKDRNADIKVTITGYALSIASVFPLAAKKSFGGRGVVSPKSAIWMQHKAWSWAQGNADDMRQTADMLETHDETLVDIYASATGKSKADIRAIMEKETWTKGADAITCGLADETDSEEGAQANYRPLTKEFLSRCKAPAEILNTLSAGANGGQPKTQQNEKIMNKKLIVALLVKHGIEASESETEEQLQAKLEKIPVSNVKDIADIRAEMAALKEARLQDRINAYVDANKITKAEAKVYLRDALASPEREKEVFEILDAKEVQSIGGESAGSFFEINDGSPNISKNGVQGSKVLTELDNIFAAHKEPAGATPAQKHAVASARYDAMKAEFPKLLARAFRKDAGVQAGNTFSATVTTNFLILGVITKLYNRFAAARIFTRDAEQDPYKPLADGIRKFNTTTTDGTKVGKNVTNFETLVGEANGNPDSVVDAVTISPDQYTSGGFITNAQLNSGFRVADIVEAKLIDLASKTSQVLTAPITTANFTTNTALISAPAAFGFSDLATLQGQLKKTRTKNMLLDGEYRARISNQPGFFQMAGTVGGVDTAWQAYGWDNIALQTDWSGAGANVRGFACGENAIGIISGLPLNPPEGIPGNIVQTGVAMLPDVELAIATYVWFSAQTRTLFFTFDEILGATLIDETAGVLIKSA